MSGRVSLLGSGHAGLGQHEILFRVQLMQCFVLDFSRMACKLERMVA
jgi:hypothetical protein